MPARRPSLGAGAAILCAAAAFWVSFGRLTFLSRAPGASYAGVLPSPVWLAVLVVVAAGIVVLVRPAVSEVAPLWLSAVLLLPWLPVNMPASVFIWTGQVSVWLWAGIAAILAVRAIHARPGALQVFEKSTPTGAAALAGCLSLFVYGLGAWQTAPQHPSGDEPHYLIMTQSLLEDGDLQIENNHRQGDFKQYSGLDLRPDYLRRGANGAIYSSHAPGLSALLVPFFALYGYPGAVAAIGLASALASALVWRIAWRVTGDVAASWFGWAVTLTAPFALLTNATFPDGPAGILVLLGILPLVSTRARSPRWLFAIGGAITLLPWFHTRLSVIAGAIAVVTLLRLRAEPGFIRRAAAFLALPLVGAAAWFTFFKVIYGSFSPSAPFGQFPTTSLTMLSRGLAGLFFDQKFGLLVVAPVYVCAFAGLVAMRRFGAGRLGGEIVAIALPYLLVIGGWSDWWGGYTTPARFLGPLTLVGAVACAACVANARAAAARIAAAATLSLSLLIATTMVWHDRGSLVFSSRDGASRLVQWLTPVVDLTTALPNTFANSLSRVWVLGGVWLLTLIDACAAVAMTDRRRWSIVAFGLTAQAAVMAAVSVGWSLNGATAASPLLSGAWTLGRVSPGAAQVRLLYRPFRLARTSALVDAIPLASFGAADIQAGPVVVRHPPPGTYEMSGRVKGDGPAGRVTIGTDRQLPSIANWRVEGSEPIWSQRFVLPVGVPSIRIDLDEPAQGVLSDVTVKAISLVPPAERWGDREAAHGARYGTLTFFNVSGRSWMEGDGIWVGGGDGAGFVVEPDRRAPFQLLLRNGTHPNQITVRSRSWSVAVALEAHTERTITVPVDATRLGLPLEVMPAIGYRVKDLDPASADDRLLGVWIGPSP